MPNLFTYAGLIVSALTLAPLSLRAEPATHEDQLTGIEQLLSDSNSAQQDLAATIAAGTSEQMRITERFWLGTLF